jgi:hypothetical protein
MLIGSLTTSVKLSSTEWGDFEAWWNKLSAKEVEEVLHRSGVHRLAQQGIGMWTLKDANEITKGDNRIAVIEQFPMFNNIPRD